MFHNIIYPKPKNDGLKHYVNYPPQNFSYLISTYLHLSHNIMLICSIRGVSIGLSLEHSTPTYYSFSLDIKRGISFPHIRQKYTLWLIGIFCLSTTRTDLCWWNPFIYVDDLSSIPAGFASSICLNIDHLTSPTDFASHVCLSCSGKCNYIPFWLSRRIISAGSLFWHSLLLYMPFLDESLPYFGSLNLWYCDPFVDVLTSTSFLPCDKTSDLKLTFHLNKQQRS